MEGTDTVVARSISRRQKISLKFRARETNQTLLDIKRVGDIRSSLRNTLLLSSYIACHLSSTPPLFLLNIHFSSFSQTKLFDGYLLLPRYYYYFFLYFTKPNKTNLPVDY